MSVFVIIAQLVIGWCGDPNVASIAMECRIEKFRCYLRIRQGDPELFIRECLVETKHSF